MTTSELITVVGAGDVVAKRLLPAIEASRLAGRVIIMHDGVCDVSSRKDGYTTLIDLNSMGTAAAEWTTSYFSSNVHPVIVATPPSARAYYLHASLKGAGLVIAEKPLYMNDHQRHEFPSDHADLRRIFALSYYTQEKAAAWSWLQNPIGLQERFLIFENGCSAGDARELFASLGQLEAVEVAICEGAAHPSHAHRRFWFETIPEGIWFDMGVHIFSLLFALSSDVRLTSVEGSSDFCQFAIEGTIANGVPFRCEFGKGFNDRVERRFLVASYSNGRVTCDVNSCSCTIEHSRLGNATISSRYGSQRYRTIIEQVREFILKGGWPQPENRLDTLTWQQQALDLLIESWPKWFPSPPQGLKSP